MKEVKEINIKITKANLFAQSQVLSWMKKASRVFNFEYKLEVRFKEENEQEMG